MEASTSTHFKRPGWFTKNVFNQLVAGLTRLGFSVWGSRVLEVRGRTSGQWRRTPVNLLTLEGERYLVSPRGESQWVRNLRVSGEGRLLLGRRSESFSAVEVKGEEKLPVLRSYLKRWKAEVGVFFEGVGPDSSEDELRGGRENSAVRTRYLNPISLSGAARAVPFRTPSTARVGGEAKRRPGNPPCSPQFESACGRCRATREPQRRWSSPCWSRRWWR